MNKKTKKKILEKLPAVFHVINWNKLPAVRKHGSVFTCASVLESGIAGQLATMNSIATMTEDLRRWITRQSITRIFRFRRM